MHKIFFLLFFCVSALLSKPLVIVSEHQIFNDFQVEMFEDKNNSLSLNAVQKRDFIPASNKISTGYSKSSFWYRFEVKNSTDKNLTYVLEATEPFLHEIDCYIVASDGIVRKFAKGVHRLNKEGVVENSNPQFPIHLKAHEQKEVYVRIFGLFPNYVSLRLLDKKSLQHSTLVHDRIISLYLGAALALILYNFFIFLYSRDKTYLYYVLYVSFFALWQTELNGFAPFTAFSSTAEYYLTGSFIPFWIAFVLFFSSEILDTKRLFPKMDIIIKFLGYFYIFLAIYSWFDVHTAFSILNGLATFVFLFLLYAGFKSYFAGNKTALFYIIAQLFFLSMSTIFSLMTDGYLEYNLITRHGIVLGSFLEMLLFSLALAYKLKALQEEKIAIINNAKNQLQKQVQERTYKLQAANKKLQAVSITDKLTNIHNRLGLDTAFEEALKDYQMSHQEFGVILVDIDNFKNINDKYGHQVGDKILQSIAKILQEHTRDTDIVGRWGGEEFLIICPQTDLAGTRRRAELLRKFIEEYKFYKVLHVTASFGVSIILDDDTQDTLLKRVDKALYKAKESGKNRVSI